MNTASTLHHRRLKQRPIVYITGPIFKETIDKLKEAVDVRMHPNVTPPNPRKLAQELTDADGVYCFLSCKLTREILSKTRRLKVISNMAAGYDNIDVKAATERGILVTNTPNILTDTTADLIFGLILTVARRIAEGDRLVRSNDWKEGWDPTFMLGADVNGKTLGIVGLGRIGYAVAQRAKGFNMRILYTARSRKPNLEASLNLEFSSLERLLSESDFVCLCVSLNSETLHLMGETELSMMKKTAFLVNASRGPVVNEKALIKALKRKWIAGAGLDVYETEPISSTHPLTKLENVVLTPHMGSSTLETRMRMASLAADNLIQALRGETPRYMVNPEVLRRTPQSRSYPAERSLAPEFLSPLILFIPY